MQSGELVRGVAGDLGCVEAAHPVGNLLRPTESYLEWILLIRIRQAVGPFSTYSHP
ncbi:hypothetical protein BN971_04474 [Mycobacterium bohemicum DSM 44277]|uniref:Uncharacterized protein n=1 Tax=Mycobacterium bohemicum DSM 44277 TaxID=1236609 RepID=A0A0U0WEF5_MYCBE|nr:hypothetical protein BN971_04474 [Mycobacterium bohemicum DSM 44277]